MTPSTIARFLVICFFLVLILSICAIARADIEIGTTLNSYNDQYLSTSNGWRLDYIFDNGFYLSGGYTGYSELRYGGQDTAEVFIYSLSMGFKGRLELNHVDLIFHAQAGYYQPYFNYMSSYQEAFEYRHYELLHGVRDERRWTKYEYELHAGIGGEFGMGVEKKLSDSIKLCFSGGFRALKLREVIHGWGPGPRSEATWRTRNDKDFGGLTVGLSLKNEF